MQRSETIGERRARRSREIAHEAIEGDRLGGGVGVRAAHVGDVLGGEADHDVGRVDVEVGQLVTSVHRSFDAELGDGVAGAPAHRHALDHVRPRGRDAELGGAGFEECAGHDRAGGVAGAEEHDVERLGGRHASPPVTV